MRIAFDVAQTCTLKAGCGCFADSLAGALVEQPDVDELILLHHFGYWINEGTSAGTDFDAAGVSAPLKSLSESDARELWRRIESGDETLPNKPDIVHSCSFQAPATPGVPLVFTVHDISFWVHPEFTTEGNRVQCQRGILDAIKRASGFVFVSEYSHQEFEDLLGGWLEKTNTPWRVIHHAPRIFPHRSEGGIDIPPRFWLAVGSIEPRKNHNTLLDAHEIYRRRSSNPAPLLVAGSRGWRSESVHKRLENLDPSQVRYLGFIDDADLGQLYMKSLGCIFPSWYEGFGLPVVEAMANDCPVLCSDNSSIPEVGGDAVCYIDPSSAESIANAMLTLESDESLAQKLRLDGSERASKFTWPLAAKQTVDFYRTVLDHVNA